MQTSETAKKARSEYMKQYREKNREKLLAKRREDYHNNPDKYKAYQQRYWEKKAGEMA